MKIQFPISSSLPNADVTTSPVDINRWFNEEIQPHESTLRRWLHSRFPTLSDLDDLVQESYARLLLARQTSEVRNPKNYLFATARNAACDLFRRNRVIRFQSIEENEQVSVLQDETDVVETISRDQELHLLREAMSALPRRCRQVFTLRKLYGLSHAQIATQLCISKKTVEVQINVAMRRCAAFLRTHGMP